MASGAYLVREPVRSRSGRNRDPSRILGRRVLAAVARPRTLPRRGPETRPGRKRGSRCPDGGSGSCGLALAYLRLPSPGRPPETICTRGRRWRWGLPRVRSPPGLGSGSGVVHARITECSGTTPAHDHLFLRRGCAVLNCSAPRRHTGQAGVPAVLAFHFLPLPLHLTALPSLLTEPPRR